MTGRMLPIVLGSIIALVSAAIAAAAGAGLVAAGSDGRLSTGSEPVTSTTRALVAHVEDLDGVNGISAVLGHPKFDLAADARRGPLFIGVGRAVDVDRYLTGAHIDVVDDVDVDPFRLQMHDRRGPATPELPGAAAIWLASASGPHPSLHWRVRDGDYRFVLMNADATPGVAADGRFGLEIPHLWPVLLGAIVAGAVGTIAGLMLVVIGVRRRSARGPDIPEAPSMAAPAG
jgi:hypothetical protein